MKLQELFQVKLSLFRIQMSLSTLHLTAIAFALPISMKALRKMAKSNLIHGAFSLAIFKMAACQEKIPIPIFGSGEDPGDEVGQNIDEHLQSSNSMVLNLNYFIYNCFFTDSKSTLKGCRMSKTSLSSR